MVVALIQDLSLGGGIDKAFRSIMVDDEEDSGGDRVNSIIPIVRTSSFDELKLDLVMELEIDCNDGDGNNNGSVMVASAVSLPRSSSSSICKCRSMEVRADGGESEEEDNDRAEGGVVRSL